MKTLKLKTFLFLILMIGSLFWSINKIIHKTDKSENLYSACVKQLQEINFFLQGNITSLVEVREWVKKKQYPDSLMGVDLKGAPKSILTKLSNGKIEALSQLNHDHKVYKYKDYVTLSSVGDGNCFLNSFSVLLTGREKDISLALPLRVKLCLSLMSEPDIFFGKQENEKKQLASLKEKLVGEYGFAKNGAWLENQDILFASLILKRHLVVVTIAIDNKDFYVSDTNDLFKHKIPPFIADYHDQWTIYNSGNHFQPLIKP